MKKIWWCKIGEVDRSRLSPGADGPMREAIRQAYRQITGEEPQFIFSGWGGELTEGERHVANEKQIEAYVAGSTAKGGRS